MGITLETGNVTPGTQSGRLGNHRDCEFVTKCIWSDPETMYRFWKIQSAMVSFQNNIFSE